MICVVLDTNVFISALVFGGKPRTILEMIEEGSIELAASETIRAEVEGVLERKFRWPQAQIAAACQPLWQLSRVVSPKVTVSVCADPDDNRILECAVEAAAQFIITGDDDLLRLRAYEEIDIITPSAFLGRGGK